MIESLVEPLSTYASDLDFLVNLVAWFTGIWLVLSEGVFFWLIWKYRAKEGVRSEYITGEEAHQKRWVTWPHYAVLVCDVFIIYFAVTVWVDIKQTLPPAEATVRIISQQWGWTFQHPGPDNKLDTKDDIRTTDELHVKVGTTYHYKLESLDVLHDFSVPVFRLKQDAIPGRVITGWFKATGTGEHDIQCAEICGIAHGMMGGRIFIETPEEHEKWMQSQSEGMVASKIDDKALSTTVAAVGVP
ncbi:MAG: cytochrome C oxidase subunit II [Myxococcota bacterium]|nr:cytochrome C oxidase subunit II [Myxococcota bacterium]